MKIKIMAVDDDPLAMNPLKTMLVSSGYDVLAFTDSRKALKRLEVEKVDGLFVDVHMPHLDGFELTQIVRTLKLNGRIPIIMLTGSDDGETMRKGFNKGVNFFLGKPFTRERLRNLLGAANGLMVLEHLHYIRVPLLTTVGCSWGYNTPGQYTSESQDISEGGIRLGALAGLDLGQGVSMVFALPDISKTLSINGQMVRKVPNDGIGIKFISVPPTERSLLQQYISACTK